MPMQAPNCWSRPSHQLLSDTPPSPLGSELAQPQTFIQFTDQVARQFLEILKATSSEDQAQLETIVPKADYRNVFLKLSRNLAPTGKSFDSIEFRTATGDALIALTPDARNVINQTLKKLRPIEPPDSQSTEEELIGVLRAVDLDNDFLDVTVDGHHSHVVGLGDAMDDVIGPMVNKKVRVQVVRRASGPLRFRDIELDEYFQMQTSLSPSACRVFLGCQIEEVVDELNLSKKIISCHPSNLPLPDHVDCFVALNRSPSRLEFSEALLGVHSTFDGSMILFENIV